MCGILKSDFIGHELKPNPGKEGATTWKPASFRPGSIFLTSAKKPGQPCKKRRGMAFGLEDWECTKWRSMGPKVSISSVVVY